MRGPAVEINNIFLLIIFALRGKADTDYNNLNDADSDSIDYGLVVGYNDDDNDDNKDIIMLEVCSSYISILIEDEDFLEDEDDEDEINKEELVYENFSRLELIKFELFRGSSIRFSFIVIAEIYNLLALIVKRDYIILFVLKVFIVDGLVKFGKFYPNIINEILNSSLRRSFELKDIDLKVLFVRKRRAG
ncbi:hypothetical protein QBC45DRAFT_430628 [Copromyces sp. CBS 386.78]|nr:hypothetical protein QBC45DRAFT_430628 [Copromyces sp. CBS 386.78]